LDHQPNQLSGGQRQRVATPIATNRLFLLMNLQENLETSFEMKLFGDIHANGNTVILVTHEEEIASIYTILCLRDGLIESDTQ
jgi:putative ABC transport system ATP-binding protein